MYKKIVVAAAALVASVSLFVLQADAANAQYKDASTKKASAVENNVDAKACYACHEPIKKLRAMGKHAGVNCTSCHTGLAKHVQAPGPTTRPVTNISWETCGQCHKQEYQSFLKQAYHRPARDEKSQLTGRSPNPFWDKLMAGHGFTKEHNTTRSHPNMLTDQYVIDRAFGGRFQPKHGWNYIFEQGNVWDILYDTHPESKEQKVFLPQTAAAANSVCLQCKTQDSILKWSYLGDPVPGATWSRTSNVVEAAKDTKQGFSCIFCHDPHAAKPRIVRDALIQALTRPGADTLWHNDPKHTNITVIDMGLRGYTSKTNRAEEFGGARGARREDAEAQDCVHGAIEKNTGK